MLEVERKMKNEFFYCPMKYAKNLKLRFWVGDLDPPGRRGIPVLEWRRRRKLMHGTVPVTKQ